MAKTIDVEKLTITEVDSITAYNNADELEFIMDEVQEGSIANTQDKAEVTGKGGRKISSIKRNKSVTVSASNGWVSAGALAAQTGTKVENGTFEVRKTEIITVKSDKAVIEGTPSGKIGNEIGNAYIKNKAGSLGTKFEQDATVGTGKFTFDPSTKTLAFEANAIDDGTEIVVFYDEEVESARVSNDSDTFSKVLKLYIDVTLTDPCDNVLHGQFIIPRADFNGEFDLTFGGDGTVHSIEAESLAGGCSGNTCLWDLIVY